ncbi:MAG: ABC transporter permease [Deltaproteobacteria bacterium]|nr:ABC transporter permease [Deltaproteobacteria bacterium]
MATLAGRRAFRPWRSRANLSAWTLSAPAVLFIAVLFVYPLLDVVVISFTDPTLSFVHYREFFSSPLYSRVLGNTFWFAFMVTVICLLLGYPLAYVIVRYGGTLGFVLLLVVGMSFWTSFLVRTYSWLVILGSKGPVTKLLAWVGFDPVPQILFNSFATTLGMVHILIPYMILSIYAAMQKIDPNHLRAAASLGATPFQGFRTVFLPLSMPGVVNGCTLVFIICLGFYVTPVLLGGPRDQMIAGLIGEQIEELLEWGFASAMAVVLLATTMALLAVYNRLVGLDKLWG